MKRRLSALLASVLLAGGLMLPACGGSSGDSSTASTDVETTEEAVVKVNPVDKFVGDWKIAAAEANGVKIVGDLSLVMGSDNSFYFSLKDDGTGTFGFQDEKVDLTWKLKDDDSVALEVSKATSENVESEEEGSSQENETTTVVGTYQDGEISINMDELSEDGTSGTMIFTPTGKSDKFFEIVLDDAKTITSKDELVGTWKIAGMNIMGLSVYGDSESLGSFSGQTLEDDLTFKDDDTGTLGDADITWAVDEDGAYLESDGIKLPIKKVDDSHITIGLTDVASMEMALLYTK